MFNRLVSIEASCPALFIFLGPHWRLCVMRNSLCIPLGLYAQDSSPLLWDRCSLTERICIRTDIPAGPSIDRFCCVGHTIACWPEHSPRSWSLIGVDFALCAIRRVFSVSLSAINSSHHFIISTQSHYAWHDVSIRNTTLRTLASFRGVCHPRKSTRTKLQVASVSKGPGRRALTFWTSQAEPS